MSETSKLVSLWGGGKGTIAVPTTALSSGLVIATDSFAIGLIQDLGIKKAFEVSEIFITEGNRCFNAWGNYGGIQGWNRLFQLWFGQFPGCCGIALVHDVALHAPFNQASTALRETFLEALVAAYERISYELGYTMVMATEVENNEWAATETKAYVKAKWEIIETFNNARTSNKVRILRKVLR